MNQTLTSRRYDASIILDTRGVEETIDALIEQVKKSIEEAGGEVTDVNNLGRFDFIRVTNKKHLADFYLNIAFNGPPDIPRALQENLRLDKTVKHIIVKTVK